jgi:hypothetical protein
MRVISVTRLKEFCVKHASAERDAASDLVSGRAAHDLENDSQEVQTWPSADIVES